MSKKKLKKTIKAIFTNNIVLKIGSILLAVLIWLAVVNVSDPTTTVTIKDIPITVTDESVITDQNKVYTVTSEKTADITVTGNRSVVENLIADDFEATASLAEMSSVYSVPVTVTAKKYSVASNISITQKTWTITVEIEDVTTVSYEIDIEVEGTAADGYVAGSVTAGKSTIDITAAESVHKSIGNVMAVVDIDGVSESFSEKCAITVYDTDGNEMEDDITLSSSKVKISVEMMRVKDVPVEIEVSGDVASGYEYTGLECSVETVSLVGDADSMKDVDSIVIPEGVFDITGMKADYSTTIDLTQYLPDNVSIYGQESDVTVTVSIDAIVSKKYTITADDVTFENLADGFEAEMTNEVTVTLTGIEDAFIDFDENDLSPVIDLSDVSEGENEVSVSVTVPDGITVKSVGDATVEITSVEDD